LEGKTVKHGREGGPNQIYSSSLTIFCDDGIPNSKKYLNERCYLGILVGDGDEKKRIHWQAWWKLCIPKNQGGMGFRDLQCFNLAMLAKQVWRLLCEPESLCARVLRAKYFPDGRLLHARMKSGSSFTWQSILAGLECFKRGYIWRVGDGS